MKTTLEESYMMKWNARFSYGRENNKMESHSLATHAFISVKKASCILKIWMKRTPELLSLNLVFFLVFFFFIYILEGNNTCMFATSSKIKDCFAHKDNSNFKSDHVFDKKKKYKSTVTNCIHFPFLLPFYKYHIRHGRTRLKVAL